MINHYGSSYYINLPVPAVVCGDGREWGGTESNECNPAFALLDLKARITRQSSDGALDDKDQVALMKLGRFKERLWSVMVHAMKGHVDLSRTRKAVCSSGSTWHALIVTSNLANVRTAFFKRN
jgi:hypothetical protein